MDTKTPPSGSLLIGHIADTHLRDTQYATVRRGFDFFEAFKQAVSKVGPKVDLFVLVGDIFDRPRPSPRVIGQLMTIDHMLRTMGKRMLAVTGNHDWSEPTWLSTLFPDRAGATSGIVPLDDASVEINGFRFTGVKPHGTTAFRNHLAVIEAATRDADVVLYHNLVADIVPFYAGLSDPLTASEFPISMRNKAWLLGDIHHQGYAKIARPGGGHVLTGYPGSLEMCSASEPTEKSVPLIRLTAESATVEEHVPISTRPYIRATVTNEADLEALMVRVTAVKDYHPVVSVEFDRSLMQVISRLHAVLDAQRAVIRCYARPAVNLAARRQEDDEDAVEQLDIEYFVRRRFTDNPELEAVALALLHRGETDTNNIVSDLIERRLATTGVREED